MRPPQQLVAEVRDTVHSILDGVVCLESLEVVEEGLEDNLAELGNFLGSGGEDDGDSLCEGVAESSVFEGILAPGARDHVLELLCCEFAEPVNLVLDCCGEQFRMRDDSRDCIRRIGTTAAVVFERIEVHDHQLDDHRVVAIVVRIALASGVSLVSRQGLDYDVSGLSFLSPTS